MKRPGLLPIPRQRSIADAKYLNWPNKWPMRFVSDVDCAVLKIYHKARSNGKTGNPALVLYISRGYRIEAPACHCTKQTAMPPIAFALITLATAGIVIPQFFLLGFTHILPDGPDHILFILGLFFLARNFSVLLLQMTLFTLAHSLTLGLSLYGIISVSTTFVEVAIALSISFIAIENLFTEQLSHWRPWVVFAFGLIHGLGFAHTFQAKILSANDFLPALFSFNVGIEAGQLVVVGLAFAAVGAWWKRDFYVKAIARPASALIALTGLYWAVDRACF